MPRPLFDIEQYELRGIVPEVFTREQKLSLNRSLGRAHGQVDWTAQLLGYNGPNYWGKTGFKADGTFTWTGLPSTMAEKRQLQVGTYGIFNKDRQYEEWPAPFNRSEIGASGDGTFHLFEEGGNTIIAPYGLGEQCSLFQDPTVFVGGVYIIDGEIEFYNPNTTEGLIKSETFSEGDLLWTRLYVLDVVVDDIGIRRKGSEAEFFYFKVRRWRDISDWNLRSIASQFLGVWGNKGASVSLDAQFDALHLHGFDERLHLISDEEGTRTFTLSELFASVGGKVTPWSAYHNLELGFKLNGSDIFYPVPQDEEEEIEFYDFEDCDLKVKMSQLIEGDEPGIIDCCNVDNDAYTKLAGAYIGPDAVNNDEYDPFNPIIPDYCVNAIDGGSTLTGDPPQDILFCDTMEGDVDPDRPKGIGGFTLEIDPKTDCALDRLCLEWVFNSALDNGSFDTKYSWPSSEEEEKREANCCLADNEEIPPTYKGPNLTDHGEFDGELLDGEPVACEQALVGGDYPETYDCDPEDEGSKMPSDDPVILGPWITFDEGEYDEQPFPNENIGTSSVCLREGDFVAFDDGIYDEPREPNCDIPEVCPVIDGDEITAYAFFPDYDDCECSTECCVIDNFPYTDMGGYLGPDILDGGIREIGCCVTDNGIMGPGPFEGEWNVEPVYSDCGPDSGINPFYCCDAHDNEEYVYTERPYYGPDNLNGCTMFSRVSEVIQIQPEPILPEDFDWPPQYTDNGVLGEDEYNLDAEDPLCMPLYCRTDNERYQDLGRYVSYSVDNCTMPDSGSINDDCPEYIPPRPDAPPLPDPISIEVFETYIEDCKSCWEECVSCDLADMCPVDDIYVKVNLKRELLYTMHPGLENAYTPLRIWKAPTLNVTDEVRNHDTERYNFLVADENRGTNPEDAYRAFLRLPLEYARDGHEWSKVRTVCENMLYWSSTSNAVDTRAVEGANPRPVLYEEAVGKDLGEATIFYSEDYLYSNIYDDRTGAPTQPGFEESSLVYEPPSSGVFNPFVTVEYDPLKLRKADSNGDWRGLYYRFSSKPNRLSGYVARDLYLGTLEVVRYEENPTYDASIVKYPLTQFPEDNIKQAMKDYVISYAYFAADYSASDEPVFEPEQDYCHRDPVVSCSTTDKDGRCLDTESLRPTNYLLHPVA